MKVDRKEDEGVVERRFFGGEERARQIERLLKLFDAHTGEEADLTRVFNFNSSSPTMLYRLKTDIVLCPDAAMILIKISLILSKIYRSERYLLFPLM